MGVIICAALSNKEIPMPKSPKTTAAATMTLAAAITVLITTILAVTDGDPTTKLNPANLGSAIAFFVISFGLWQSRDNDTADSGAKIK